MLKRIDDWLIDELFQPWADDFQAKTGKSCYFLVCIFSLSSLCISIYLFWDRLFEGPYTFGSGFLVGLYIVYIFAREAILACKQEREFRRKMDRPGGHLAMSPNRPYWGRRMVFNAILGTFALYEAHTILFHNGGLIYLLGFVLMLGNLASMYFNACTPKIPPPKRETVPVLAPAPSAG